MIGDLVTALLLIAGAGFVGVAGLGLLRMQDVYIRMHAATKAGTLGAGLVVAAVAVDFGDWVVILKAIVTITFLFLTAPVAAHMIGRAAYRMNVPMWERSVVDEWGEHEANQPPPSAAAAGRGKR